MIFGAEIGLTVYGLIALIRGSFSLGKGKPIQGLAARLLGFLCMCTIPIAFMIGIIYAIIAMACGVNVAEQSRLSLIWIDLLAIGTVVGVSLLVVNMVGNSTVTSSSFAPPIDPSTGGSIDSSNPYSRR